VWRSALSWVVALAFALAPLQAQALMAGALSPAQPHDHQSQHQRPDHAHQAHQHAQHEHHAATTHAHGANHLRVAVAPKADPAAPVHHHDHGSAPHDGCCGTFCHTVMAEAGPQPDLPSPPHAASHAPLAATLSGTSVAPSLPPPKPALLL
jgi:hypothetical protein